MMMRFVRKRRLFMIQLQQLLGHCTGTTSSSISTSCSSNRLLHQVVVVQKKQVSSSHNIIQQQQKQFVKLLLLQSYQHTNSNNIRHTTNYYNRYHRHQRLLIHNNNLYFFSTTTSSSSYDNKDVETRSAIDPVDDVNNNNNNSTFPTDNNDNFITPNDTKDEHLDNNLSSETDPSSSSSEIESESSSWYSDANSESNQDLYQQQRQHEEVSTKTSNATGNSKDSVPYQIKPWLDVHRPLHVRIHELLESNTLHPADLVHPAMEDLIKQCCMYNGTTSTSGRTSRNNTNSTKHNSNNKNQNIMEGLQFAQDILDRCFVEKRRYQTTNELKLFVPQKLIQIVLFGWAKIASYEVVAQQRMKELLHLAIEEGKMDEQFLHVKLNIPRTPRIAAEVYPTVNLFNTYIIGLSYAAKITPQAALDAEALLYDMIEYNRTLGWHTKPNTRSFTNVIVAYTNTKHVAAGRRAYQILQRMKTVHDAEKEVYEKRYEPLLYNYTNKKENKYQIVTPDAIAYTATLNAIQISNNRSHDIIMDLLNEAVSAPGVVLDPMLFVVTIKSLSSVIDQETHTLKRIELATEAENILRTMIEYSTKKGFQNINVNYDNNKNAMKKNLEDYVNDTVYIDDNDNDDESVLSLPVQPEEHYSTTTVASPEKDNGNDEIQNDNVTNGNSKSLQIGYNACIYAWAQSYCKEGAVQCEILLNEMIDSTIVQPDATTFNTCIHAWSKSHKFHPDAGQRAIQLLQRQFELSKERDNSEMKPDFQSFTSCILVLSKSKDDDRLQNALALLQTLLEEVKLGNLAVTRNPTAPFSAVLTTIANYKIPAPATVDDNDIKENGTKEIDVFNSTIDTQTDPYSIANNIFDQIEKDTHQIGTTVDHHCVTAFLKCVAAHSVPGSTEREYTSRRVFHDTCQAGYVSRSVLKEFHYILGPAANTFPDLRSPPKFWSRNVPNAFR